ncbi:MAG: HU family DNA-binding protein [Alphaproteobacteria bacterium]|nr:HU family DNA-binding protein [Alphaproteobacteria bacterium]
MNKAAFIDLVANLGKKDVLTRAEAKRAVDEVFDEIATGLKASKVGFFKVGKAGARKGRNLTREGDHKIKPSKKAGDVDRVFIAPSVKPSLSKRAIAAAVKKAVSK